MDQALGCLLGLAVGDAAGAVLEFQGSISPGAVAKALRMPGGGHWSVGPGQCTDDTELALALANGLCGQRPRDGFPRDAVAQQYSAWFQSGPFDCGATCATAFSAGPDPDSMQEAAFMCSAGSKANGALMRAAPIAIWAHRLGDTEVAALAAADAMLSHPNTVCQDASAAYCIALAQLIRSPGDSEGAVGRAEAWASRHADPEVRQWLLEDSRAEDIDSVVQATRQAGFVKHAFTLAFWHLRRRSPHDAGLCATLAAGGDTDTNTAIVGAMLGALWGQDGIPPALSRPVLQYMFPAPGQWPGHDRPSVLRAGRIPKVAQALFRAGAADQGATG